MSETTPEGNGGRGGDRRGRDRRGSERRRTDRRTPPPPWRHPAAFVAYGVVGALILVVLFRGGRESGPEEPVQLETVARPLPVEDTMPPEFEPGGARPASSPAEFEALVARGDEAVGQVVRTVVYCSAINPVAVRDAERIQRSVADLVDANRRVPAAECQWGVPARGPTVLVLVPPEKAEEFARSPEVEEAFVRRKRVAAEVEWVGRSEALALRQVVVLREIAR